MGGGRPHRALYAMLRTGDLPNSKPLVVAWKPTINLAALWKWIEEGETGALRPRRRLCSNSANSHEEGEERWRYLGLIWEIKSTGLGEQLDSGVTERDPWVSPGLWFRKCFQFFTIEDNVCCGFVIYNVQRPQVASSGQGTGSRAASIRGSL